MQKSLCGISHATEYRAVYTDNNEIPLRIWTQKINFEYFMIYQMNFKWTKYMLNIFHLIEKLGIEVILTKFSKL